MPLWISPRLPLAALVVGASLAAPGAMGSDGVLEINRSCAVQTGCFPGDAPGFPVTLTAAAPARSVRLTGDLTVVTGADTAIDVSVNGATIDLGGFRIVAPAVCSGVPVTSCTNSGLEYDQRGATNADSGFGPPANLLGVGAGWVRTGETSQVGGGLPGVDNCSAWTSTSGSGTSVSLGAIGGWNASPSTRVEPWNVFTSACNGTLRVWCVED